MKYLFLLTILCTNWAPAGAQQQERNRFPKAILVQLSSECNRLRQLEKAGAYTEAEQVRKDARIVAEKMRMDFKDNFRMYPVYFYADTNYEQIKAGNFTDVLMDVDGDLMERTELDSGSTDFFIIYYGYPKFTKRKPRRIKAGSAEAQSFDSPTGKYLVICNSKLEQMTYVHTGANSIMDQVAPEDKKYKYVSRRYDISYRPAVKKLPGILTGLSLNYQ